MSTTGSLDSGTSQPQPTPRRKKHHEQHQAHGGSWKVAYADFVTAMLALFIVLWILSQGEDVKEAVSQYFTDPVAYKQLMKQKGNAPTEGEFPARPNSDSAGELQQSAQNVEKAIEHLKQSVDENLQLKEIRGQVEFLYTDEGILIEVRDAAKFDFFAIGSAQMSSEMVELVRTLTPEVIQINSRVVITGHTDRRQYESGEYTNWELSADRANSVRRRMIEFGLAPDIISEIRSYADTRLRNPQDPFAPENRRVSILLLKKPIADPRDKIMVQTKREGTQG